MRKILLLCIFYLLLYMKSYAFLGAYLGWQNFISPVLKPSTQADILAFGMIGNIPNRFYFQYAIQGHFIITQEEKTFGHLGWGCYIEGCVGYRFLNPAYKKYGWDLGIDVGGYFNPYFLNSQTGYTETAFYYGILLGTNIVYKINPYIGIGTRMSIKYNIGTKYLSSRQNSCEGLLFSLGPIITF